MVKVLVACELSGVVRDAFRAKVRSQTYTGIAEAMANQWGQEKLILGPTQRIISFEETK